VVTQGNVGIGTQTPGAPLEVSGANSSGVGLIVDKIGEINNGLMVQNFNSAITPSASMSSLTVYNPPSTFPTLVYGSSATFMFNSAGVDFVGGTDPSAPYSFYLQARSSPETAQDLTLDPLGGNVGIGTRSPGKLLTVAGNADFGTGTPTLSSCGTSPSLDSGSNDMRGEIVVGTSATGCTLTFSAAKTNVPFCLVASETSGLTSPGWTESTTAITITGVTASDDYAYMCMGN
jgi:hypothetical protein